MNFCMNYYLSYFWTYWTFCYFVWFIFHFICILCCCLLGEIKNIYIFEFQRCKFLSKLLLQDRLSRDSSIDVTLDIVSDLYNVCALKYEFYKLSDSIAVLKRKVWAVFNSMINPIINTITAMIVCVFVFDLLALDWKLHNFLFFPILTFGLLFFWLTCATIYLV